jgi:hypothetical protein
LLISLQTIHGSSIIYNILSTAYAEKGFLDGFGDFIESIGDFVEGLDFSSLAPDTSHSGSKLISHHDNWFDTYLSIRLVDSLFQPNSYSTYSVGNIGETKVIYYPTTLADLILKQSLLAVTSIALSLIVIFIIIDLVKCNPLRGKRFINICILWVISILGYLVLYVGYHLLKILWIGMIAFFPHFWPYFLGISVLLFGSYCILTLYKRSDIRIVRQRRQHII